MKTVEEKRREKKRGQIADRRAVWKIGAQSESVEKSLHLNAPLRPNNSWASEDPHPMLRLLSSASLCIRAPVKGTHLVANPSGCVCVCVYMYVSLFKEVLCRISGFDCSHSEYCLCGSDCHGNDPAIPQCNLANHSVTTLLSGFLPSSSPELLSAG